MILRHRDRDVLRFDWVDPFGVKNVERVASNDRFLPLSFRDRVLGKDDRTFAYELEEWLLRRTAPLNRHGIRETLRLLGFAPEDPKWKKNLLTFSRALSLNDVYWLVKDDSSERWADANLYRNPFSTAVATMAFTGERQKPPRDASTSPEYSTDGNLAKCWRRIGGEVLLYKGGTRSHGGFDENDDCGFEPYSEYYAAQLATAMKLPHVDYGLAEFKHRICSTCPLFTSEKVGYLPARALMSRDEAVHDSRFADIFFFDAVIFNTDRHLGNFGFLVDNETNEISGVAPIFDNGYGLFSQARNLAGCPEDEFCDLRRFASRRAPKLYRDWLDIPGGVTDEMIDRLKGLQRFEFRPHAQFAMPGNRLAAIQYFVRKCISDLVEKREKSTIYVEIAGMRETINAKIARSDADADDGKARVGEPLKDAALLAALQACPTVTRTALARRFGVSAATIARHLTALRSAGEIRRVGSRKTGSWMVVAEYKTKAMKERMNGRKMCRKMCCAFAALAAFAAAGAARAEVNSFPACPWSETRVVRDGGPLRVTDAAGRDVLRFNTEGGDFTRHLVVSQAVDGLVIDTRAAFAAGMTKLAFTGPNFDPAPYRGQDCTLVTDLDGLRGTKGLAYFEGNAPNLHFYRSRPFETKGHARTYALETAIVPEVESLHLRWDVTAPSAKGPLILRGARYGLAAELPAEPEIPRVKPKLLFHAAFDGTAEATRANGSPTPCRAEGLSFAEGRIGQAVRLNRAARSALAYAAKDNLVPERGTVAFWFRREWPDRGRTPQGGAIWRTLFANPPPKGDRIGSGQLWFWFFGGTVRADLSDNEDRYSALIRDLSEGPQNEWTHLAVTWDERGAKIYLNGRMEFDKSDGDSPMIAALKTHDLLTFRRETFDRFCVGNLDGDQQFDGLLDDLRIYSAPLSPFQVNALFQKAKEVEIAARGLYALDGEAGAITASATSPRGLDLSAFRYCLADAAGKVVANFGDVAVGETAAQLPFRLPAGEYALRVTDGTNAYGNVPVCVLPATNPHELTGAAAKSALKAPGVLADGDLEPVASLTLDRKPGKDSFRAVGPVASRSLGATPYLEAGPNAGDRFALRFDLGADAGKDALLYLFEIDYPDDAKRTADILVHRVQAGEYTTQVGYATGDEYPNTGKILTHRVLYWARERDVALIAMTARTGAPAAVAAVRVFRVKGNALPAEEMREPKATRDGWNRVAALYFEDPAIGFDFALPKDGATPDELNALIDRTAALMKFTGENLFAYPGAWYHGLIGDDYQPRRHAPDFLSAWYVKFDREGLFLMPTVNPNTMPLPRGLNVTKRKMHDGSLHDTVISIHDTGKPSWGGWHDTPPNFNFHHPKVRGYISDVLDALVEQGAGHPSFKGVALHVTRHCLLTFGDEASGYNDYTVRAFAKAKGLTVPAEFAARPLRGADYAKWLRANAWEDWLQWRCDQVTDFYVGQAKKLAARRGDLKLWINYMIPANGKHPDFMKPDFMARAWRGAGLDAARLSREAPNVILGQTMVPADYRWKQPGSFASAEAREHQRTIDETPGFYANLKGAAFPLVHQHDRYWESAIGTSRASLTCDWLKECRWRVSTINPSGRNALRHFVEPLRFGDVLGVSKGGFLIGTYGMEEELVPFLQAFRALPAVVMRDVAAIGDVRVRQGAFGGEIYFYVVNTGLKPSRVTLDFPAKTRNLVTGEVFKGGLFGLKGETRALDLAPYELRSFSAPRGNVRLSR